MYAGWWLPVSVSIVQMYIPEQNRAKKKTTTTNIVCIWYFEMAVFQQTKTCALNKWWPFRRGVITSPVQDKISHKTHFGVGHALVRSIQSGKG